MPTLVQTAARNVAAIKGAGKALQTPQMRALVRQVIEREYADAAAMSDETFWGYDKAWYSADRDTLIDVKQPGMCGGGGCNDSLNNNQFWRLEETCTKSLFALVIYQQRRYIAAQMRLFRLMENPPQKAVLDGFDRFAANPAQGIRAACGGQTMRDAGPAWAYWCEEVLRLVGVARWASNFTWSNVLETAADYAGAPLSVVAARAIGGPDSGCTYAPDCSSDSYGVVTIGYVRGTSNRGLTRWMEMQRAGWAAITALGEAGRNTSARPAPIVDWPNGGVNGPSVLSIAPAVLGLHRSTRKTGGGLAVVVPQDAAAFTPKLQLGADGLEVRGVAGPFQQPQAAGLGSWLLGSFLELPEILEADGAAWQEALRFRDRTGFWALSRRADRMMFKGYGAEMLLWYVVALAREVMDTTYGDVMIQGFNNLDMALQKIPVDWRVGGFAEAMQQVRQLAQELNAAQGAGTTAAFSAAGGAILSSVPIAGLVLQLAVGLGGMLQRYSLELGVTRRVNPPVLQYPAYRVGVIGGDGDDRCAINPTGSETLNQYQRRVTGVYAEAAQRTGGKADAMYDIIPQIRREIYCAENPGAPDCQSPITSWPFAAAGGAVGTALTYLLLGV